MVLFLLFCCLILGQTLCDKARAEQSALISSRSRYVSPIQRRRLRILSATLTRCNSVDGRRPGNSPSPAPTCNGPASGFFWCESLFQCLQHSARCPRGTRRRFTSMPARRNDNPSPTPTCNGPSSGLVWCESLFQCVSPDVFCPSGQRPNNPSPAPTCGGPASGLVWCESKFVCQSADQNCPLSL
jgi:hypothetical protein